MGDHGLWFKSNFTQGACHIPFIVTPPVRGDLDTVMGADWLPGVNHSPVGLQDILPTCLRIAGLPIPEGIDGKNLWDVVHAPNAPNSYVRETILGEFGNVGGRSFMVTDGVWKYIWFEEDGEQLLFHIAVDPDELVNQALTAEGQCKFYRDKLLTILKQRNNDPAVAQGQLRAMGAPRQLSQQERVRLISDQNVRGFHI
jgi:arylsulfatase A-like enzyme